MPNTNHLPPVPTGGRIRRDEFNDYIYQRILAGYGAVRITSELLQRGHRIAQSTVSQRIRELRAAHKQGTVEALISND